MRYILEIITLILLISTCVLAIAPPQLPTQYWGNLIINNSPAEDGTLVKYQDSTKLIQSSSQEGVYSLILDNIDSPLTYETDPECLTHSPCITCVQGVNCKEGPSRGEYVNLSVNEKQIEIKIGEDLSVDENSISLTDLNSGWNQLTFPIEAKDNSIPLVFRSLAGKVIAYYNFAQTNNNWKGYDSSSPSFSWDLGAINLDKAYWIFSERAQTLSVVGNRISFENITLDSNIIPPRTFYSKENNSKLENLPLPIGTTVSAYDSSGRLCGNTTLEQTGRFSLHCKANDLETSPGDLISFKINGIAASVISGSAIWQSGFQEIDISATNCLDSDKDKYSVLGGGSCCGLTQNEACEAQVDCDDSNFNVNPKALDVVCDGQDNNCNSLIDENYTESSTSCGIGECAREGLLECINGTEIDSCIAGIPQVEICDSLDNDCDALIDENILDIITGSNVGECKQEIKSCVNGNFKIIQNETFPRDETCDNKDNNCNSLIDENLTRACGNVCFQGLETCEEGAWGVCNAEEVPLNFNLTCSNNLLGVCQAFGKIGCDGNCNAIPLDPQEEICDIEGLDEDCDGQVNEDCECFDNDDCANLTREYCSQDIHMRDQGVCVDYKCEIDSSEVEDCGVKDGLNNECGMFDWSCSEELNRVDCVITNIIADDSLCSDESSCNGEEICNNVTFQCESGEQVDCSVFNIPGVNSCFNIPDGNNLTFDFREEFISECVELGDNQFECTTGNEEITHECNLSCEAECDSINSCSNKTGNKTSIDYCLNKKLVDYNNNSLKDSETIFSSCPRSCNLSCGCGDCSLEFRELIPEVKCVIGTCDANCKQDSDCQNTICSNNSGCTGEDYYDYSDSKNKCDSCLCEINACNNYTVSYHDLRCLTCEPSEEICNQLDDDCDGLIDETCLKNIQIISPLNNSQINKSSVLINISLINITKVQYFYGGRWNIFCTNFKNCYKTLTFPDGPRTINFIAQSDTTNYTTSLSIFTDSVAPTISAAYPASGLYGNGTFSAIYTELYPKSLELYINSTNGYIKAAEKLDCAGGSKKSCNISYDLSAYNGKKVAYYFNLSDSFRSYKSKVQIITADTIYPTFNFTSYVNKTRMLRVNISEIVTLSYWYAPQNLWKSLCTNCLSYNKAVTFTGSNFTLRAVDLGGNPITQVVEIK